MLFEDGGLLMDDEESGSNRDLGYLFLYNLLSGTITATVGGKDCTASLGRILTRGFHLKQARYGRTSGQSLSSLVGSSAMGTLSLMLDIPSEEGLWMRPL